ncbi:hypothetical protein BDV33DRAFT_185355 [Aspergillus novoparasiticus]|uniref:Uncharacterized protein n=1 Tax=Aspergillus novoparasiticus TaxID=986946 RepID=A0A5N6E8L5_9EURO|nr:hypothetical protein BDV33DRAFT_185355 [Aspergillus novoparasiticus]
MCLMLCPSWDCASVHRSLGYATKGCFYRLILKPCVDFSGQNHLLLQFRKTFQPLRLANPGPAFPPQIEASHASQLFPCIEDHPPPNESMEDSSASFLQIFTPPKKASSNPGTSVYIEPSSSFSTGSMSSRRSCELEIMLVEQEYGVCSTHGGGLGGGAWFPPRLRRFYLK